MNSLEMEADMQRDMENMQMEVEEMFKKYGISRENILRLIALIKTAY